MGYFINTVFTPFGNFDLDPGLCPVIATSGECPPGSNDCNLGDDSACGGRLKCCRDRCYNKCLGV